MLSMKNSKKKITFFDKIQFQNKLNNIVYELGFYNLLYKNLLLIKSCAKSVLKKY